MKIILRTWQVHPNGAVHLMLEHALGGGGRFYVHTTKRKCGNHTAVGVAWCDNAAILAEAQARVDAMFPGQGLVVALPGASK